LLLTEKKSTSMDVSTVLAEIMMTFTYK